MLDQDHPAGRPRPRASPERHLLHAAHPHLSLAIAIEPILEAHPQRPFPWDITLGLASDTPRRRPLKFEFEKGRFLQLAALTCPGSRAAAAAAASEPRGGGAGGIN